MDFPTTEGTNYNPKYWASPDWSNTWGGSGTFRASGTQPGSSAPIGASITQITAWQGYMGNTGVAYLARLDFTYSDDSTNYIGVDSTSGLVQAATATFDIGETITSGWGWTNHWNGAYINMGYKLNTSQGQSIVLAPNSNAAAKAEIILRDSDPLDVGCGKLLGAISWNGQAAYMSLLFLKKVAKSHLTNVTYTTKPDPKAITPEVYESLTNINTGSNNSNFEIKQSKSYTTSSSWSIAVTAGLQITQKVSAGLFDLISVGAEYQWSLSTTVNTTSSTTSSRELSWTAQNTTPPHTTTVATLSYAQGDVNIDYSGTLNMTLADGTTYSTPVVGTFTQAAVGSSTVLWTNMPNKSG